MQYATLAITNPHVDEGYHRDSRLVASEISLRSSMVAIYGTAVLRSIAHAQKQTQSRRRVNIRKYRIVEMAVSSAHLLQIFLLKYNRSSFCFYYGSFPD